MEARSWLIGPWVGLCWRERCGLRKGPCAGACDGRSSSRLGGSKETAAAGEGLSGGASRPTGRAGGVAFDSSRPKGEALDKEDLHDSGRSHQRVFMDLVASWR